jgi:hydrogenase-4 component E
MSASAYLNGVDLLAGGLLVMTVAIVWRRDLAAMTSLLTLQGLMLGAIPVLAGIHHHDGQLIVVGIAVGALRAGVFPRLLRARLRGEPAEDREAEPLVSTSASLLAAAVLIIAAYVVAAPIVDLAPAGPARAAPVGVAMVFIGVFLLVTRRKALSQVIGLLVLDNGIDAVAFVAATGVPVIVELGASLDVLLGVVVLGVLTGRMYTKFGGTDLDDLRELHE